MASAGFVGLGWHWRLQFERRIVHALFKVTPVVVLPSTVVRDHLHLAASALRNSVTLLVGCSRAPLRVELALPALVFAGLFAGQKNTPVSVGTLPTDSLSFAILLTACLIVMTALSYLPVLP